MVTWKMKKKYNRVTPVTSLLTVLGHDQGIARADRTSLSEFSSDFFCYLSPLFFLFGSDFRGRFFLQNKKAADRVSTASGWFGQGV